MAKFEETVTFHRSKSSDSHRAIVFIHGGAWIDPSNTPHDFDKLAEDLTTSSGHCQPKFSIYAIEYRLSPEVKHPTHLLDVLQNLAQLVQEEQIDELNLLGHSVGATLIWQLLTCNATFHSALELVRSKIKRCYLADGIFSLSELLQEYPTYDYFVSQAYSAVEDYEDPTDATLYVPKSTQIHIVHSYSDELLSMRQSNFLCGILQARQQRHCTYWDDLGKHNDVYRSAKLAEYITYTMMY
ncbi:LAFA_0F06700g1_1 [Lachancea sp. 'fantastica']|nr:LAFA_0F06700g1_1 [Lachancea sp. 'fantastica']